MDPGSKRPNPPSFRISFRAKNRESAERHFAHDLRELMIDRGVWDAEKIGDAMMIWLSLVHDDPHYDVEVVCHGYVNGAGAFKIEGHVSLVAKVRD